MDAIRRYQAKCDALIADLAAARAAGDRVALAKSTSNLFRRRNQTGTRKLDVRRFNSVLDVDRQRMIADVEGMTTYEELVDATLARGLLPTVVPQLKTITVGGAVSGVGIESSSFRFGLVHETVEEMEILTGQGTIVRCSRTENPDLFFGFPNSYGTLGYVLRLKVRLIPARPFVHLTHSRFSSATSCFSRVAELCSTRGTDYLDGTVFSPREIYLTEGEFRDEAPRASDYTYLNIYYKSIQSKTEDWLTVRDYIWRWDTDWFWCSKQFHAQNPFVRLLATRLLLNSRTYQRLMRAAQRVLPETTGTESVIQDVDIPLEHAAEFLDFLFAEIGIRPVWLCPFQSYNPEAIYPLYAFDPRRTYVNFGFWDTLATEHEDGWFNRKIEKKASELDGKKGLYSTSYYDCATFWKIYNKASYDQLKSKYDPAGVFRNLYEKCVGRR